jgi:hypothetical protein
MAVPNAQMVYLGRDAVATLTKTAFPASVPDLASDTDINEIFVLAGLTATATSTKVIDAYNATDWADAAKPAVATHIMVSVKDRQWKQKDAMLIGDLLVAMVAPKGARVLTS